MSILGKILRSSTAAAQNVDSDNANLLDEFRPASVGVLSANSTDFVSLREELVGNDLFQQDTELPGTNSNPNLLPQKPQGEQPYSQQQQQHDEKASTWRDFATPVLFNNQKVAGVGEGDKDRPTSRKLYLGVTGTGTNESSGAGADVDGHSDVRITYIGGSDRPGTTADRDALQTKMKSFHRPTKSAGARPNPLRVAAPSSADPDGAAAGPPTLQRMSSFGGFEEVPKYLVDQYRITYSDADLKRPPSRQGTAFPMDMDAAKRKPGHQSGGVDLADLDSDDDIFMANNRAQTRVSKRSIRSAPGRRHPGVAPGDVEAARKALRDLPPTPGPGDGKVRNSSAREGEKKAGARQASAGSQRGLTPAEILIRGLNDPEKDGFTELGNEPSSSELPFKIHVQYSGKSKGRKSLWRKEKEPSKMVYEEKEDINPTTAEVAKIKKKQRPALEIIGTSSTKGSTELKQTTENEKVDDYMEDDVGEEGEEDEDEDDEDIAGYDDEDEDVHAYTNEGNLAIQELETNLDMDFLQLFASSTAAATAHGGV